MAAPSMGFSAELAVSLRSVIVGLEDGEERVTNTRTAQTRAAPSATTDTPPKSAQRRARPLPSLSGALVLATPTFSAPSIGTVKRYPRLANVSMNTGLSADSPRASLRRLTAALRP